MKKTESISTQPRLRPAQKLTAKLEAVRENRPGERFGARAMPAPRAVPLLEKIEEQGNEAEFLRYFFRHIDSLRARSMN